MRRLIVVIFSAMVFLLPQVAAAQDPTGVPDQPTLITSPTLPVQIFTNGHPIDSRKVASMCDPDCAPSEVASYVDSQGVLNLDGVYVVAMDGMLGFTIEPGYTAVLFTWTDMDIVLMSDQLQVFPAMYNRAFIFNGNLPSSVRSILQSSEIEMNELCEGGECSAFQAFAGVGVAFSYDPDNTNALTSEKCTTYIIPENVVVEFNAIPDESVWSSGPMILPGQCGRVWVSYQV